MATILSPAYTQRRYSWTDWKAVYASKGGQYQYDGADGVYLVWFYDGPEVHLCSIWQGAVPAEVLAEYSQSQNDSDKVDWEVNFKSTSNKLIESKTSDGKTIQASEKSDSSRTNFYSHDWTDPTTWYSQSILVTNEIAVDAGNHMTYTLTHQNVIDTYHGKLTQEDNLKDAQGNGYRVSIKIDGVSKIEQNPHLDSGGDYVIDYAQGTITFNYALQPENVMTVTYHYANGSRFTVAPTSGKKLVLDIAEVQFSDDVVMKDSVVFEVYGIADYFLTSQQMQAYGIPAGIGYKISLQKFIYKAFSDFQNDAFRAYPVYPAIGGDNWRAQKRPILVFDWDYVSSTVLSGTKGMEIRIYLQHDVPFDGWMGTATMYCKTETE